MTIEFLVPSLTKALLPPLLSLAQQPALGRVLVVPNLSHLRIMEAIVLLGTFNAAEFLAAFFVPRHSWHGMEFAQICSCAPYIEKCVPFQTCPINLIYPRWTLIKM